MDSSQDYFEGECSPLGISDVNYFENGHDEVISIISPEELADEIRSLL
ncbi:MAG: hypothetical protein JRJ09_18930 [Deltaproteobacteria bacterium]|nr:hypothetical protein [Deltaproteobacteria bacterium]